MAALRPRPRPARRHVHVGRPPTAERDARRSQRREALLDAAVAAIARYGADATMTAMASEAGVTKPVLYRYFGDRAGLYEALAARFAAGLVRDLDPALHGGPGGLESVELAIGAYLSYVEANAGLYRFLVNRLPAAGPDGQRLVRGFVHRVATQVAAALDPPLRAAGVPPARVELVAFGITGMVQLGGDVWLEHQAMPRPEAVTQLAALAWQGLAGAGEAAAATRRPAPRGAR